jgi:hypothetical protein
MGRGFAATLGAGMISGVAAGRAGRAAENTLNCRAVTSGLWNWREVGRDTLLGGASAGLGYGTGRAAQALTRRLGSRVSSPCSFSDDTLVLTAEGEQPIGGLEAGDRVLAYNETLGQTGLHTITDVLVHVDPLVAYLTIDSEQIETTPEHPFYTEEHGWLPVAELWPGATVRRADGSHGVVQTVAIVEQPQVMYNLTVAGAHTFFVGAGEWLVHNTCPIYGKAQVTKDPAHASMSQARANQLARRSDVTEVHLNRSLKTVTGGRVTSRLRPDVVAKYREGRYQMFEIVSPRSQTQASQIMKIRGMEQWLLRAGIGIRKGFAR